MVILGGEEVFHLLVHLHIRILAHLTRVGTEIENMNAEEDHHGRVQPNQVRLVLAQVEIEVLRDFHVNFVKENTSH
jgi:hypothetical protein